LQTSVLFLGLFTCPRAAAVPQLSILGSRKAREVGPAMLPRQEREANQAGSYHPSNPDVFTPR